MSHLPQWILVLGLGCLLGAAPAGRVPVAPLAAPRDSVESHTISVDVENDNVYDATIYAVRPGFRQRIGQVLALQKGKFSFMWPHPDLRFEVALFPVGSYYTQSIVVEQGDELELTVAPYLHTLVPGSVF
jgi:hypothetical protein